MSDEQKAAALRQQLDAAAKPVAETAKGNATEPPTAEELDALLDATMAEQAAAAAKEDAAKPEPAAKQEATKADAPPDTPTTATSFAKQVAEPKPTADRNAEILEHLRFFFPAGERHELLAIAKTRDTFGGVFDDLEKMAECAVGSTTKGWPSTRA